SGDDVNCLTKLDYFYFFWVSIQSLMGIPLITPLMLYGLYLIVGRRTHHLPIPGSSRYAEADYAIIVTAYGQTDSLPATLDSILRLHYSRFLVYVVIDNCDNFRLHFDDERVIVLKPDRVLVSNTRSHFYAIERFRRPHEYLTII